jgi:hypothetical protein
MLLLQILTGKKAGTDYIARKFPVAVGRSMTADLPLDDAGVWDKHFEVQFSPPDGLTLKVHLNASVSINEQSVQEAVLRNGDIISVGSLKIRFSLSPVQQRGLFLRETLTWLSIIGLCILQIALIFFLAK